jgi:O-antigen/teichoic acid export membrane protein
MFFGIASYQFKIKRGAKIQISHLPKFFVKGAGFQAGPLWQALLFQGSLWLASSLMGAGGAALWSTIRMLSRSANQMLQAINETVWPELQRLIAFGEISKARNLHNYAILVSCALAAASGIILCLAGSTILSVWTSGALFCDTFTWFILALGLALNSVWWVSSLVPRAYNMPWHLNIVGVVASIVSLITTWLLGPNFVQGFAIGSLVFEVIMAIFILPRSLHLLGDSIPDFIKRTVFIARHFYCYVAKWNKRTVKI